jgi:type IV secretion system protein VirD4
MGRSLWAILKRLPLFAVALVVWIILLSFLLSILAYDQIVPPAARAQLQHQLHRPPTDAELQAYLASPASNDVRNSTVPNTALPFAIGLALATVVLRAWLSRAPASTIGDGSGGTTVFADRRALGRLGWLGQEGYYLGTMDGQRVALPDEVAERHVLVVGPTGSGKSSGLVIPQLVAEAGKGRSIIVTDPKLELHQLTAPYLGLSHHTMVWAPMNPELSARYDPLAHVRSSGDAAAFAERWVAATGRSDAEPYFDQMDEDFIAAGVMYLKSTNPRATVQDLRRLLARRTGQELLAAFVAYTQAHPEDEIVGDSVGTLAKLLDNPKTGANVTSGFARRFRGLRAEEVVATTSGNDIRFADLVDQPTILYVSLPFADAAVLAPLSASFYATLLRELQSLGGRNAPLPRPVRVIMDEFGNVGRIADFPQMLTTLRSKRVSITVVVQSTTQLTAVYGEADGAIIRDGCATAIALGGVAEVDAQYFSRRTGTTTMQQVSASWKPQPIHDAHKGTTTGWQGRALLMPDEVRQLDGQGLVISGTAPPFVTELVPYFQQRALYGALQSAR